MYEYAQRLAETTAPQDANPPLFKPRAPSYPPQNQQFPNVQKNSQQNIYHFQSQAYLIAINALKLTEPKYQWFVIDRTITDKV